MRRLRMPWVLGRRRLLGEVCDCDCGRLEVAALARLLCLDLGL